MAIIFIQTDEPGQISSPNVRRVKIITSDNLSTVTTAGYLREATLQGYTIFSTDVIDMWYGATVSVGQTVSSPGTYEVFTPTISNGVITLTQWTNPGDVLLPVTSGDFAVFNGTSGQIKDAGYLPSNAAKTNVVMLSAAPTSGHVASFADTSGTVQDAGFLASNVMLLNTTNTLTSAGSIVANKVNGTEATNAVTASGMSGIITTSSLTTAGGSSYAITWTNTFITATSTVLLTIMGGTNTTENITLKATNGIGTSTLTIYNNTASTNLNGTILIGYLVI